MARRFAPTCARRAWGRLVGCAGTGPQRTKRAGTRQPQNVPLHRWEGKWDLSQRSKCRYSLHAVAVDGPRSAKYVNRGKYPTRWWAETSLSRDRRIERAQYGARDRGGAVAAAEFAGLEARRKGAIDGGLNGARGLCGAAMAMTVGEPVEHQRGGENHGGRIGEPLAHDVGRGAVAGLEHRVRVADIGRGRHAHAADQPGGQIR